MNDCITCGRRIRFRAMKVTVNRKRGCAHWLEPADGETCPCLKDWAWTKWRSDKSRPTETEKRIAAWNEQNSPAATPNGGTTE